MNFDYGKILGDAVQITWKHKTFWVLLGLPILLSFLLIPFFIAPAFLLDMGAKSNISETSRTILVVTFFSLSIILGLIASLLGILTSSAVTLGVIRVERGETPLDFMSLIRDSIPHFIKVFTAILIINLSIGLVFTVFFVLFFVLTIVTIGMASICFQPIMILLTPLMFLLIGVIEGSQTAIIAENLSAIEAVKRAVQIVRENIWKYLIIMLIAYVGSMILSSLIITPLIMPVFIMPFFLDSADKFNGQVLAAVFGIFACIFFPLMTLVSSITGVFMKISLSLTYLRLSIPQQTPKLP